MTWGAVIPVKVLGLEGQAIKNFHTGLFDWKLEDIPTPDGGPPHAVINLDEGIGGGMFANAAPVVPSFRLAHVGMDDLAAFNSKTRDLGVTVLQGMLE